MTAGLGHHALAGIHQQHSEVGGRSAGDHVARVLLVPGGVGDDEFALVGGKKAVGHVDRDALFDLGLQAIDQQREVQIALTGRAKALGGGLERRNLVIQQQFGIVEQTADQR